MIPSCWIFLPPSDRGTRATGRGHPRVAPILGSTTRYSFSSFSRSPCPYPACGDRMAENGRGPCWRGYSLPADGPRSEAVTTCQEGPTDHPASTAARAVRCPHWPPHLQVVELPSGFRDLPNLLWLRCDRYIEMGEGNTRECDSALVEAALAAASWAGQKREIYTRVLTHNLMLLKRRSRIFYRAIASYLGSGTAVRERRPKRPGRGGPRCHPRPRKTQRASPPAGRAARLKLATP